MANSARPGEKGGASALVIKRYEMWIALATVVGTLAVATTTLVKQFRSERSAITVNDTPELRAALKMPLEGAWRYQMKYGLFHGKAEGLWRGDGEAAIRWMPMERRYEMLLGAEVRDIVGDAGAVVVHVIKATIPADEAGFPKLGAIPFSYVARLGSEGYKAAGNSSFQLETLPTAPVDEFQLVFDGASTKGSATLTRQ